MTTLAEIAQCDRKTAALGYHMLGLSIIPLAGKKPAVEWRPYQRHLADAFLVKKWFTYDRNVGIICGAVSKNLVVVDLDGLEAVGVFRERWPEYLDTFTVATGSGRGQHLYFRVEKLPPTSRLMNATFGNIEIRAEGTYVAAAPSIHPDTEKPYTVANPALVKRLVDLYDMVDWLKDLAGSVSYKPPQAPAAEGRTGRTNGFGKVRNPRRYAEAALYKEAMEFRNTPEGGRNVRLNVAAYNLGQMVKDGWISADSVRATLANSARLVGLPEREALATIESGLRAGMDAARSEQWQKRAQ